MCVFSSTELWLSAELPSMCFTWEEGREREGGRGRGRGREREREREGGGGGGGEGEEVRERGKEEGGESYIQWQN